MQSYGHCLARLFRFRGRDRRRRFWPYAAGIIGASLILGQIILLPIARATIDQVNAAAARYPDGVHIETGAGGTSVRIAGDMGSLFPDLRPMLIATGLIALAVVILLAAAVVRRLHDSARSGWWGMPTLFFLATGFALTPMVIDSARSLDVAGVWDTLFPLLMLNNLLYLVSLLVLVVSLAAPGSPGPNRHGPPDV